MSQKRVLPPSLSLGHTPHLASPHVSSLSVGGEGAWNLSPEGGALPSREVAPVQGDSSSAHQTHLSKGVWLVKVGRGLCSSCFCPFLGCSSICRSPRMPRSRAWASLLLSHGCSWWLLCILHLLIMAEVGAPLEASLQCCPESLS